ncbi:MAG TPA: ferritin-like domain-containing protein [Candidatus Binatia bacterium]|nr:ferritin-like domain-containing protein [Candidatus Binatia bacterium]
MTERAGLETQIDPSIPADVAVFSYYRNAEQHGANLLFRLLRHLPDPDAQISLSEHLADETRHAWLWTDRIVRAGAKPLIVCDGYQTRIGRAAGMPRDVIDLLALTVVVEQRALRRYQQHLRRPGIDADTESVLRAVTKDEAWHIDWIRTYGRKLAGERGEGERFDRAIVKYRAIDKEVVAHLEAAERELAGGEDDGD